MLHRLCPGTSNGFWKFSFTEKPRETRAISPPKSVPKLNRAIGPTAFAALGVHRYRRKEPPSTTRRKEPPPATRRKEPPPATRRKEPPAYKRGNHQPHVNGSFPHCPLLPGGHALLNILTAFLPSPRVSLRSDSSNSPSSPPGETTSPRYSHHGKKIRAFRGMQIGMFLSRPSLI